MKPDELLRDLGRLARAQAQLDAVGEEADELLRPLDAAAHERIVARLLPLVQPERQTRVSPAVQVRDSRTPRQPRSRRWVMASAPALAVAAVVLLLVWASPDGRLPGQAPEVRDELADADPPLPGYALELHGGSSIERGTSTDAILRVGTGDRVSAVLRPAMAVGGTVAARVFIDGQALGAPGLVIEQSADGAVRISELGPVLAALPPGRHQLQFAVGRPGHLTRAVTDGWPRDGALADRVQLLRYVVERVPR
jgi:hypothetical protein